MARKQPAAGSRDKRPGPPKQALLSVPEWIWNNNPTAFLSGARYRGRPGGAADKRLVQTEEAYFRRQPNLTVSEQLAGAPLTGHRFWRLDDLSAAQPSPGPSTVPTSEIQRRRDSLHASSDPVDHLSSIQLLLGGVADEYLATAAEAMFDELSAAMIAETRKPVFDDPSVHVLKRDTALYSRAKYIPVLLRLAFDDSLAKGEIHSLTASHDAGEGVFASSEELFKGLIMLDPYVGPLLGCLSPGVWGFAVHRSFGPLIYSFGRPIAGTRGDPAELLQMLSAESRGSAVEFPELTPGACSAAISWWASKLDKLMGVVTDPTVYTKKDGSGVFVPAKQMAKILNIEQVFRRVHAIQTSYRDHNARKTLMFTVLDTMSALLSPKLEDLFKLKTAQRALDELRSAIPSEAAEVLLPSAERAVKALEELQLGFFLSRQLGHTRVTIPYQNRAPVEHSYESAAALYLTVLRNATHGFGGDNEEQQIRSDTLLALHTGEIPYDLPELGYLYLLLVLVRPNELRNNLFYRSEH